MYNAAAAAVVVPQFYRSDMSSFNINVEHSSSSTWGDDHWCCILNCAHQIEHAHAHTRFTGSRTQPLTQKYRYFDVTTFRIFFSIIFFCVCSLFHRSEHICCVMLLLVVTETWWSENVTFSPKLNYPCRKRKCVLANMRELCVVRSRQCVCACATGWSRCSPMTEIKYQWVSRLRHMKRTKNYAIRQTRSGSTE